MKRHHTLYGFLMLILFVGSAVVARAQDSRAPVTDAAARAARPSAVGAALAATGPRTSPFEPLPENDRTFVTDGAPGLDTGCTFRSGGPLIFNIEITRHVGKLKADGTLENADALVAAGLLSPTATLLMPAFDVDSSGGGGGIQPERDRVTFNGEVLGFLNGIDNTWVLNRFEVPIGKVKFAQMGSNGSAPAPALNQIRIDIDTANSQEAWCTSIDWGTQSFKAMSPIILIHGNNSDGGFYDRMQFTDELRAQDLLYNNKIQLLTDSVAINGGRLQDQIPSVVREFGVDSVHLVVHSKGGLDTREYLAAYYPRQQEPDKFKVLSYTSLSTPHNGSVAADLLMQRAAALAVTSRIEYKGFPDYTKKVAEKSGADAGTPDLTTGAAANFNSRNLPLLPSDPFYNTVAADANRFPGGVPYPLQRGDYAELIDESPQLQDLEKEFFGDIKVNIAINVPYQIIRDTSAVTLHFEERRAFLIGPKRKIAVLTALPTHEPRGNDVLVPIFSGSGVGTFGGRVTNRAELVRGDGRNHASVANRGVAVRVIPWIIDAERARGDLR